MVTAWKRLREEMGQPARRKARKGVSVSARADAVQRLGPGAQTRRTGAVKEEYQGGLSLMSCCQAAG